MITTRRSLIGGLASLFAAPAIVRADSLMKVHNIPERYATVWGVGWDLEVVEHVVWTPEDALSFAQSFDGPVSKFREVTEVVYTKPLPPLVAWSNHWTERPNARQEWFAKEREAVVNAGGVTNLVSFGALNDWREQQRPELGSVYGRKWADETIRLNKENGRHTYHDVHWKYCPLT